MRLFGKVDGVIDRFDRAEWLTMPFDLAFAEVVVEPDLIPYIVSMSVEVADTVSAQVEVRDIASTQVEL